MYMCFGYKSKKDVPTINAWGKRCMKTGNGEYRICRWWPCPTIDKEECKKRQGLEAEGRDGCPVCDGQYPSCAWVEISIL